MGLILDTSLLVAHERRKFDQMQGIRIATADLPVELHAAGLVEAFLRAAGLPSPAEQIAAAVTSASGGGFPDGKKGVRKSLVNALSVC